MTNETQQTNATDPKLPIPFGGRLKTAREALGLDRKDAAAQLRLNEKIIIMMEKERYPSDLPVTFIRGYIRAYGKLLQIPEYEIKKAIEPIKPKPTQHEPLAVSKQPPASTGYFMQFFTYLVMFTLVGLVGMWWYTHPALSNGNLTADNQPAAEPSLLSEQIPPVQTMAETPASGATPSAPTVAANAPAEQMMAPPTPAVPTPTLPAANNPAAETNPPAPAKPAYLQKSDVSSDAQADDAEADDSADNASDDNKTNPSERSTDNNDTSPDNTDATD